MKSRDDGQREPSAWRALGYGALTAVLLGLGMPAWAENRQDSPRPNNQPPQSKCECAGDGKRSSVVEGPVADAFDMLTSVLNDLLIDLLFTEGGCGSTKSVADPVIMPSGAFRVERTDAYVAALGGFLPIGCVYDSVSQRAAGSTIWPVALFKHLTFGEDEHWAPYWDPETQQWVYCPYFIPYVMVCCINGQEFRFTEDSPNNFTCGYCSSSEYSLSHDGSGGYWLVQGAMPARWLEASRQSTPRTWYFDSAGHLTGLCDTEGRGCSFSFDSGAGVITRVTNGSENWTIQYDAGQRITRVSNPGGSGVGYYYTSTDLLTKVEQLGGTTVTYEYDAAGLLTAMEDGNGAKVVSNLYDSSGRVTCQTTEHGQFTWTYSGVGGQSIMTCDNASNQVTYLYDTQNHLTRTVAQTNRNVRAGEGDYTVDCAYGANNLLTRKVYASGNEERRVYDGAGNLLTRVIAPNASESGDEIVQTFEYETTKNLLTRETDGRGNATCYLRDGAGQTTRRIEATATLGQPAGQSREWSYAYDGSGALTREVNPLGRVTAHRYDANGWRRTTITDEGGLNLATAMSYDTIGNLTETISSEGSRAWYGYDGANRLTREVQVLDNSDTSKQYATTYWYDGAGRAVSKKIEHKDQAGASMSPSEYLVTFQYDTQGYLTRETFQVDATNTITRTYCREGSGRATKIVAPNGTISETVYDERLLVYQGKSCGGCGSTQITYDYDGNGNVITKTDAMGNKTISAYDTLDRVTRAACYDNQGTPALLSYNELEYDKNGNTTRTSTRDASDTVVARATYYYDEANRLYDTRNWANPGGSEGDNDARTVMLYDAASTLTKQKTYLSGTDASPVRAETSYYYDNADRQTGVADAEGGNTSYAYDKDDRLTSLTDADGKTTAYLYDMLNRTTQQTDAGSNYVVAQYDSLGGVLTTINYASGGTALAQAAQDYDGLGRVTLSREFYSPGGAADDAKDDKTVAYYDGNGLVTKTTDPLSNSSTMYYDTNNRLQWSRDPLGNKIEYAYDSNNNVLTTISYELDQVNGVTKTFTIAALYDGLSRGTKVTDQGKDGDITQTADNGFTVLAYDARGRKTSVIDAEGVASSWTYDSLGRLTRQTEDIGTGRFNRNTDQAYDRAGRMTQIRDGLSQSTNYAYDKLSRLTRTSYADGGSDKVDQVYDKTGAVTKRTDQRGIATLYLYDSHHQLTKKQDDPVSPTIVETYTHDALGRTTLAQLVRSGTTLSDVRYYYDGLSRRTRESQQITAGTTRNVDMVYDQAGNRITLNYPGGKSVARTYDADNRVSMILDGANARAAYNYVGPFRRSQIVLKNAPNTVSLYKLLYDGAANITCALYLDSGDTTSIIGFQYEYDKFGNPKYEARVHESNFGDVYSYDKLYRVTRAIYDDSNPASPTYAASRTDDFQYDSIGNRVTCHLKSGTATTYLHNAVNEYTTVAGNNYLYDAAGNLTQDATYNYFWDYENRLTMVKKVSDGSDIAEYTYDAMMRRIEKIDYTQTPNVTTRFYQDGWRDIEERDGSDSLIATYVNGPRTDEYITMNRNSTDYWYMQSPIIGNVAALVNSSGVIQEGYTYAAYGTATVHTGAGADGVWFTSDDVTDTKSALGNPFSFTGRRLDSETMLMHFRFRVYQPATGNFIGRDRAGYLDGMSLYLGYFAPANVDPFGLWILSIHREMTKSEFDALSCKDQLGGVKCMKAMRAGLVSGSQYPDVPESYWAVAREFTLWHDKSSLTYRSHFGDLQNWHGMASQDGGKSEDMQDNIVNWVQSQIAKSKCKKTQNDCRGAGEMLGRALHTIEDTYAPSHVARNADGEILQYYNYADQDSGKHSKGDIVEGNEASYTHAETSVGKVMEAVLCRNAGADEINRLLRDDILKHGQNVIVGGGGPYAK